jgi:hypothetical protein
MLLREREPQEQLSLNILSSGNMDLIVECKSTRARRLVGERMGAGCEHEGRCKEYEGSKNEKFKA